MTTAIDFAADFAPYRERAAALTAAIIACQPGVLDDVKALLDELDERFVEPLTELYMAVPVEMRASDALSDIDQQDAIWHLVHAYAGLWELGLAWNVATGAVVPAGGMSACEHEAIAAGLGYREMFGPAR